MSPDLDSLGDGGRLAAAVATILRMGGVAALPAEGVYGIHALASEDKAVERLRALKGSSSRTGFIGLLAEPNELAHWGIPEPKAVELARRYWPGPLTLVVPGHPSVPPALRAEDGSVALRCPGSTFLRAVVREAKGIVLSTSANLPGKPPAVRVEEIPPKVADMTVDGGELSGIPSTLVRVQNGRVEVLRKGALGLGDAALDDDPGAT